MAKFDENAIRRIVRSVIVTERLTRNDPERFFSDSRKSLISGNRWARVTTQVSAATDATTWGTGVVVYQGGDGTLMEDEVTVDNLWIGVVFPVDAQVTIDTRYSPPRVLNGTCAAVTWESEEEVA